MNDHIEKPEPRGNMRPGRITDRIRQALVTYRHALRTDTGQWPAWYRVLEEIEKEIDTLLQPTQGHADLVAAYGDACATPDGKRLEACAALLAEITRLRVRAEEAETRADGSEANLQFCLNDWAKEQDRLFSQADKALNEAYKTADAEWHKTADKLDGVVVERDAALCALADAKAMVLESIDAVHDQARVCEYVLETSKRMAGYGEDPVGFLIGCHAYAVHERNEIQAKLAPMQEAIDYHRNRADACERDVERAQAACAALTGKAYEHGATLDAALEALARADGEDVPGFLMKRGYVMLAEFRKLHDTPPTVLCVGHDRHKRVEVPMKKVPNGMGWDWRGACPVCGHRFLAGVSKNDHEPGFVTLCPDEGK